MDKASSTTHSVIGLSSNEDFQNRSPGMPTPPPIHTDVRPVNYTIENATPRAQDLREVQNFVTESQRIRSSSASSLERMQFFFY